MDRSLILEDLTVRLGPRPAVYGASFAADRPGGGAC